MTRSGWLLGHSQYSPGWRRAIPSKVNRESAVSGQVGEPLQDLDSR